MVADPTIQPLVEELALAMQELYERICKDDYPGERGPPCTEAQLATVAADLQRPLPPTYESFLRLHNGWTYFMGEGPLLSVEARHAPWYPTRLVRIREHLASFGQPDFLDVAFPLLVHPDVSDIVYLDTSRPTAGGELETVHHSLREGEYGRYPSFKAFLEVTLSGTRQLAGKKKKR